MFLIAIAGAAFGARRVGCQSRNVTLHGPGGMPQQNLTFASRVTDTYSGTAILRQFQSARRGSQPRSIDVQLDSSSRFFSFRQSMSLQRIAPVWFENHGSGGSAFIPTPDVSTYWSSPQAIEYIYGGADDGPAETFVWGPEALAGYPQPDLWTVGSLRNYDTGLCSVTLSWTGLATQLGGTLFPIVLKHAQDQATLRDNSEQLAYAAPVLATHSDHAITTNDVVALRFIQVIRGQQAFGVEALGDEFLTLHAGVEPWHLPGTTQLRFSVTWSEAGFDSERYYQPPGGTLWSNISNTLLTLMNEPAPCPPETCSSSNSRFGAAISFAANSLLTRFVPRTFPECDDTLSEATNQVNCEVLLRDTFLFIGLPLPSTLTCVRPSEIDEAHLLGEPGLRARYLNLRAIPNPNNPGQEVFPTVGVCGIHINPRRVNVLPDGLQIVLVDDLAVDLDTQLISSTIGRLAGEGVTGTCALTPGAAARSHAMVDHTLDVVEGARVLNTCDERLMGACSALARRASDL